MANLVRWDPFQSFPRLHAFDDSFDELLRRFGRSPSTRQDEAVAIAVDVSEDDSDPEPDHPLAAHFGLYHYLGFLLENIVRALS